MAGGGKGRAVAWSSVGTLVLAAVAAAVFSAVDQPPGWYPGTAANDPAAAARLVAAARADLAAGSFTEEVSEQIHGPGRSAPDSYRLLFDAPDRAELLGPGQGQGSTVIIAGNRSYTLVPTSRGAASWIEEPVAAHSGGRQVATQNLDPLLYAGSVVDLGGGRYRLTAVKPIPASAVGQYGAGEAQLQITATVAGGQVRTELVEERTARSSVTIRITYGQIGRAPPVTVPPADQVVAAECAGLLTNLPGSGCVPAFSG